MLFLGESVSVCISWGLSVELQSLGSCMLHGESGSFSIEIL